MFWVLSRIQRNMPDSPCSELWIPTLMFIKNNLTVALVGNDDTDMPKRIDNEFNTEFQSNVEAFSHPKVAIPLKHSTTMINDATTKIQRRA